MNYVATIGFFDGVHTGHRYLISRLRDEASRRGMQSAILTFEQHPESVLCGSPKPLLTTFAERTERLKEQHVDEIFCFNFEVIHQMTAEDFMRVLVSSCGVRVLLMGYDHHFGSDHLPSFAAYQEVAERVGLTVLPIDQAPEGDVSSSKIRRALQRGAIESVNVMLGYPYTLTGRVVHGKGVGRQIGFPTANIEVAAEKMLPKDGVYEVEVYLPSSSSASVTSSSSSAATPSALGTSSSSSAATPSASGTSSSSPAAISVASGTSSSSSAATPSALGTSSSSSAATPSAPVTSSSAPALHQSPTGAYPAILNIGTNPTLGDNERTVELHIPHFSDDLYDQTLSVRLLRFVRVQQRFDSLDALREQIAHDIAGIL